MDDPLGSKVTVAETMTPLVALALNSSDRRESPTGNLEADRLILGRLGAGSGVLLRGTSGSSMISLLLPGVVNNASTLYLTVEELLSTYVALVMMPRVL